MLIFILAAAALLSAAILWCHQAFGAEEEAPPPEEDAGQRIGRLIAEDPHTVEALAEAVRALEALMAHPELGGPGFLLIQFPAADGGCALVTAQYPNIREGLYRRIVRQELDGLAAAGAPEALLAREPSFETESGGVVLASVRVGGIPYAFAESMRGRRERSAALDALAEALGKDLPGLSVRVLGADLLLSPERAAISTDE